MVNSPAPTDTADRKRWPRCSKQMKSERAHARPDCSVPTRSRVFLDSFQEAKKCEHRNGQSNDGTLQLEISQRGESLVDRAVERALIDIQSLPESVIELLERP